MSLFRHAVYVCAITVSCYAQAPKIGGCSVFPADNIWNTPIDTLPVHKNSAAYISRMGNSPLRFDFGPGYYLGGLFGMPFVTVPGTQPKYPATFYYPSQSDPGPYAVPLNAPIQGGANAGGDRHALAVDTTNCILYELFNAWPEAGRWRAGSGAIFDLKSNALRPDGWTSADAAGLPIVPALVRYDEIVEGEIRHAVRVTVNASQKAYLWPARHFASSITDPSYPPMGLRLRLKANVDISKYPPEAQIILRAMKKYGLIVADNGTSWFVQGQPDDRWVTANLRTMMAITGSMFEAVDESSLMIDPNSGQARQTGTTVAVAPSSATVVTQANHQFTATVKNSSNQAVTWKVNGIAGGNSQVGYIDANGRYSAPGAVPPTKTVPVTATSTANPTAVGTASVTVRYPAPVILSLTPTTMATGAVNLTVNGNYFQTGAVVRLNNAALSTTFVSSSKLIATGTISTAGAFPLTVTNPDAQVSGTVSVTVTSAAPPAATATISVTPQAGIVKPRMSYQFKATVLNSTDTRVIWKVNGIVGGNAAFGTVTTTGLYTAPAVPPSGAVTLSATLVVNQTKTASAKLYIMP